MIKVRECDKGEGWIIELDEYRYWVGYLYKGKVLDVYQALAFITSMALQTDEQLHVLLGDY